MRLGITLFFIASVTLAPTARGFSFYDGFEDNDISDWEPRCVPGNWSVSGGTVHGNTSSSPSFLTPITAYSMENGEISISTSGVHAFGICARVDENDSGIYAYVSPDHDVARIRLVENGVQSTIYNSISADFPSGVVYELTLTLEDEDVSLTINVPSTGDNWVLDAIDPYAHPGIFGFHMGDESNASWDWIEVEGSGAGNTEITWMITDDQSLGNGNFALEPGETIDLLMQLTSDNEEPLQNAFAILQSLNPELAVIENYVTYGTLASGDPSYGESSFMVLAPPATPTDEVYEMKLTLMADGGYQEQLLFSLPVGNGLECNVESGAEDWTWATMGGGWVNEWHVSSEKNYTSGGQYSFKCGDTGTGDYSNNHYGYLSTPLFNLPLSSEISFWMWIDAQFVDLPEALDGGLVQYGRCGNWIDLTPVPEYTHLITSGSTGPFEDGTAVFSGIHPWTQHTVIVPDSLAGPGQIRFIFGSDDSGTREGWYVDEITMGAPTSTEEGEEAVVFTGPVLSVSVNPFSSTLNFTYMLPGIDGSSIEIFDVSGRLVSSIETVEGAHTLTWNGTDSSGTEIPSGVYLARLRGFDQTTIKLIKI